MPVLSKWESLPLWLISSEASAPKPWHISDEAGERKKALVGAQVQLALFVAGLPDVDDGVAHVQDGRPAPGERP